jgi:hypothetical protein
MKSKKGQLHWNQEGGREEAGKTSCEGHVHKGEQLFLLKTMPPEAREEFNLDSLRRTSLILHILAPVQK